MKQDKLEFDTLLNKIRNTETAHKKQMRLEVIAQGGSCLTCKHTKTAVGTMLLCKLKTKYVNQHSYCEQWKADIKTEKKEKEEKK